MDITFDAHQAAAVALALQEYGRQQETKCYYAVAAVYADLERRCWEACGDAADLAAYAEEKRKRLSSLAAQAKKHGA